MATLNHTTRCCGTCTMWEGRQRIVNPQVDRSKYTVIIEVSGSEKALCGFGGSNGHSASMSCGRYQPKIS